MNDFWWNYQNRSRAEYVIACSVGRLDIFIKIKGVILCHPWTESLELMTPTSPLLTKHSFVYTGYKLCYLYVVTHEIRVMLISNRVQNIGIS
jgi:hypothetical protein